MRPDLFSYMDLDSDAYDDFAFLITVLDFFSFFFRLFARADIYPVMLDDDARYQCQVGPGPQGKRLIFLLNARDLCLLCFVRKIY